MSSTYSLYFSGYNDENWAPCVHTTTSFTNKQMLALKLGAEMLQSTRNTFSYQLLPKLNLYLYKNLQFLMIYKNRILLYKANWYTMTTPQIRANKFHPINIKLPYTFLRAHQSVIVGIC